MSYWGVGCILIGVICLPIGAVYLEKANNPTSTGFLAGLDDGIRAEGFFCASALTIISGSVLIISSNHRRKLIKPVLNNYNINHSYSDISPAILFNDYKQSFVPGFVISVKF